MVPGQGTNTCVNGVFIARERVGTAHAGSASLILRKAGIRPLNLGIWYAFGTVKNDNDLLIGWDFMWEFFHLVWRFFCFF